MNRYPENILVGPKDFRCSGWKVVLDAAARAGYEGMWEAFRSAAPKAIEAGKLAEGKLLWLLADACSMMLTPKSINKPFKPIMEFGDKRSAMPEDFSEADTILFSQIVEEIDNAWLRARLADLLWILRRPPNHKFALVAIDAYRMVPLVKEIWFRGGRECWGRAMCLAAMLRTGANDRLEEIETAMITALEKATLDEGFFALGLARLLMETNSLDRNKAAVIAMKLESLFNLSHAQEQLSQAMKYSEASANCYRKAKDVAQALKMTVSFAETCAEHAMNCMSSSDGGGIAAMHFIETAIQKYRAIPKTARTAYRIDERIADLRRQMTIAGERSLSQMEVVSSESIDISQLVESARNAVRGKTVLEALAGFATIDQGARLNRLRHLSEKNLREYPLQSLVSVTHLSRDGRVIAKRDSEAQDREEALLADMIRSYVIGIGLSVRGLIVPALEVLHLEHRLQETDFVDIASRSPIVQPGRERLVGKALYMGYDGDIASALHLLTPQIENLVRWQMKSRDVKTTRLDDDGLENELGLSGLMDLPKAAEIFGEDLAFEFKALFSDVLGPNLRNEVAHGLLDYEACEGVNAIYAWWFGFRIVFMAFRCAMRSEDGGTSHGAAVE